MSLIYGRLLTRNNGTGFNSRVNLKYNDKKTNKTNIFTIGEVSPKLFHDIFEINKRYLPNGELVDIHDDYTGCKCFISNDGLCGFAIEPNGNLISVFSLNPSDKRGFLYAVKDFIREEGATHLDAYASSKQNLLLIYEKTLSFHVASSMDYNIEYDHDDIAKNHGNPNVVFMVNNAVTDAKHFNKDEYDEAQKYAQERINTANNFDNSELNTTFAPIDKAIATNSWSEEALKQLDNLINDLENGRILFERFPQAAMRGFRQGGRINEAASLLLRGSKSPDSKNTRSFTERYERDKREQPVQERIIESWAKVKGIWHDNLDTITNKRKLAEGGEAIVFHNNVVV